MNPHPPAIPVRPTVKSTYKPISRLNGDDLPKLKRLKKAEFSNSTTSYNLLSRRTLANKLNVWHRQHSHTLDSLRKEQLGVYHVMCRVQREKRRVQREEHEQLRENIRRLFHRQRKRHLLRRVIAKFRENLQRKRAEREELEGQNEGGGHKQEDHTPDAVKSSVERFKRNLLRVSDCKTDKAETCEQRSDVLDSSSINKPNPEKVNSINNSKLEHPNLAVHRDGSKEEPDGHRKIVETAEFKLSGPGVYEYRNPHASTIASPSSIVTLETARAQKVLPPIEPSTTNPRIGKPSVAALDQSNPLITQTDAVSHVARVNTPGRPAEQIPVLDTENSPDTNTHKPVERSSMPIHGTSGSKHLKDTPNNDVITHETPGTDRRISFDLNEGSVEDGATEYLQNHSSSSVACSDKGPAQNRKPNLVKKLKKEKERRMQERAEILGSETIVRYSRKPYHDVMPMYGQPKRFDFQPPSGKLHHEQEKLAREEHRVELEHQVKIDKFFTELFKPKDDDRAKFSKKDDEAEKPKKATLSLAGVLSGVFSLQLSEARRGKQTLQDKFRRLQSCQYLRVYQPRQGSEKDTDKVTSWDAAKKSLRTGFGAFAMKR